MKKLTTILLILAVSWTYQSYAQVAINNDGDSADASAMLDVQSTDKGMLIPRLSQAEIGAIVSPANGLLVFNTTDDKFYSYILADNEWKEIAYGAGTIAGPFSCGDSFTDTRDGQSYTTVQIGTQCWMAENLNIGTMINIPNDQTNNGIIDKYCYDNNTSYCDVYGGLYQWNEMMQYTTTEGVRGICPTYWHLPTEAEWCTLENEVDSGIVDCNLSWGGTDAGGNLKENGTSHWLSPNTGATNSSGFTALPGGLYHGNFMYFGNLTNSAYFWTSSINGEWAWSHALINTHADVANQFTTNTNSGLSVRCVKDE